MSFAYKLIMETQKFQGCNDKFTDWVLQHIRIVAVIGLLLSFVQVIF